MLILLPVFGLCLTALVLVFLRLARPKFKYTWMLASAGATLALASVFLWQLHFPISFSLPPWQLVTAFFYVSHLAGRRNFLALCPGSGCTGRGGHLDLGRAS